MGQDVQFENTAHGETDLEHSTITNSNWDSLSEEDFCGEERTCKTILHLEAGRVERTGLETRAYVFYQQNEDSTTPSKTAPKISLYRSPVSTDAL